MSVLRIDDLAVEIVSLELISKTEASMQCRGAAISGGFETWIAVEAGLIGFLAGRAIGNPIGRGLYYATH